MIKIWFKVVILYTITKFIKKYKCNNKDNELVKLIGKYTMWYSINLDKVC